MLLTVPSSTPLRLAQHQLPQNIPRMLCPWASVYPCPSPTCTGHVTGKQLQVLAHPISPLQYTQTTLWWRCPAKKPEYSHDDFVMYIYREIGVYNLLILRLHRGGQVTHLKPWNPRGYMITRNTEIDVVVWCVTQSRKLRLQNSDPGSIPGHHLPVRLQVYFYYCLFRAGPAPLKSHRPSMGRTGNHARAHRSPAEPAPRPC
jgi:hypothetical protein